MAVDKKFDAPLDRTLGRVPPGFLKGLCPASSFGSTCNSALLSTTQLLERASSPSDRVGPGGRRPGRLSETSRTNSAQIITPCGAPARASSASSSLAPHRSLRATRAPERHIRSAAESIPELPRRGLPRVCEVRGRPDSGSGGGTHRGAALFQTGRASSAPAAGKASFQWAERMQHQQRSGGEAPLRRGSVERHEHRR